MRSTRYRSSFTSSSTRIAPSRSGNHGVPIEALKQREIPAGERSFGDPLGHGDYRLVRHGLERARGLGARQHSLEVASAEGRHRFAGDRSVVGDHSGDPIDAGKQCRDVRKADHGARVTREGLEIHFAEYAGQAVPAPQAPDRVDALIPEGVVEVGQPVGIGAGEITVPACRMRRHHRFVIQRTAEPHRPRYIVGSKQRTSRSDQRDATPAPQSRRTYAEF